MSNDISQMGIWSSHKTGGRRDLFTSIIWCAMARASAARSARPLLFSMANSLLTVPKPVAWESPAIPLSGRCAPSLRDRPGARVLHLCWCFYGNAC